VTIVNNYKLLYKKPLVPKSEEVRSNPRSRSAKLRAAVKIKEVCNV
jgi:16S rRNA C1402 N4-methylase RsmH